MSNNLLHDHDSSNIENSIENNDENEILCSACGFSSECVPEGMLSCPKHCTVVFYCSVECRDWAWEGSHKNACPAVNGNTTTSLLPMNDAALKSHNTSLTSIRNDSGKLGESFSDGSCSVSVASSIEVNNLFDKKPSPFFFKNKFGQFAHTSSKSSVASSPKELPLTTKSAGAENSPSNSGSSIGVAQNGASSVAKRGPHVTKSLGNHFFGNTPNQTTNKQLFVVSTDYDDEESDNDENDDFDHENMKDEKGSMSDFDYVEEQSVGMSVLEVDSVANLTAIVEESSNLMSVPVIEASWRRNRPDRNPNQGRLNNIINKPSQSQLDMENSEIIGTDSVADLLTMQHHPRKEISMQQEDDLVYGVRSYSNSESISSLMGNHNSVVMHSLGSVYNETSDGEDLSCSQASADSTQGEVNQQEIFQQPEVVESSNSSDSADPDYIANNSGLLGSRPSVTLQRGPSLRGFRDAYNECDTASLHSRSVARSISSSEDSMSSHCDAATDIPERMHRSSSSLKDFRDIYNADLKHSLLREPSTESLGCSSSFDFNGDKIIMSSPIKVKSDDLLSRQLELITIKSERSLHEDHEMRTDHSPAKSEGTTSLQMARMRNESMKNSLNSALRVYEEMYGEDAAKDVFYQLTSTAESNVQPKNTSKGEQMFQWKRSETSNQDSHPTHADNASNLAAKPVPKYMQYRTSLSFTNINEEVASITEPAHVRQEAVSRKIDAIQDETSSSVASKVNPKYMQYRTSLSGNNLNDKAPASTQLARKNQPIAPTIQVDTSKSPRSKSVPKYLQYRTSLSSANMNDEAAYSKILDHPSQESLAEIDPIQTSDTKSIALKSMPKYLQYRTSLSSSKCTEGDATSTKLVRTADVAEPSVADSVHGDSTINLSMPKYMQYRSSLSSTELNVGDVSKVKLDKPSKKSQPSNVDIVNALTSKPDPKHVPIQNIMSQNENGDEGTIEATKPKLSNMKAESIETIAAPVVPPGTARYLLYRDKLLKETSTLSRSTIKPDREGSGADLSRTLEVNADNTIISDDHTSVNETKSNSNLSCTVNSSSDAGYFPLESLSKQLNKEVKIEEIASTPSKPQIHNQFSQRYLQYRKSMIEPTISGSVNGIPKNTDNDITVTSAKFVAEVPINELTSKIDRSTNEICVPIKHELNHDAINAAHAASTKSGSEGDIRPRYVSYRLSLASMDTTGSILDATKDQGATYELNRPTNANSKSTATNKDSELMSEKSASQENAAQNNDLSKASVSEIHFELGEMIDTDSRQSNIKGPSTANASVLNPDAFRLTFKEKYKQYRSSLQSLLDSENKEYLDCARDEKRNQHLVELTPIDIKASSTADSKIHMVKSCSGSCEVTTASNSLGILSTREYQVVDLDEATASSEPSEKHLPAGYKLDETKSGCGLDIIGYSGVSCSGASIDSESFLKVWNEMEADRNSLCEERDLYESNSKAVPKAEKIQKIKKAKEMPPLYNYRNTEAAHESQLNVLDITMDEEAGLLPSKFNEDNFDEEVKLRAKKFQKKQRNCWCIMVLISIALPLGIGLGIALGRSNPTFPTTSGGYLNSTASPTKSPIPVPTKTIMNPVLTISPQINTPTFTPISDPESTTTPTLFPTAKPEATTSSQVSTTPPTRSPSFQSSSPLQLAPRSREDLLLLIVSVSSDNGISIQSTGSPQSLAFEWLVSDQTNITFTIPDERIIQRYALATLYYSTDGERWLDNVGWLSNENECSWHTIAVTENCDADGMYMSIDLSANDLTGVVPNELALLSRLETLKLSGGPSRYIGGIVPPALGTLKTLKVVDFQDNVFFGTIPSELGNLDFLQALDLSMNRLALTIPSILGRLTLLKKLNFAGNNLTGEIPSTFNEMSQLEQLSLGNNELSGQMHLGVGLSKLTELNLENNRLTLIGTEIGLLQSLETLTMYENALTGVLPAQITFMSALVRLDVHANKLTGSIPSDIGNISMLTSLDLSSNQFSDTIPSSVGSLTNLLRLYLQKNVLEGSIPVELGRLSSAFVIRINENNISGSVPEAVCENFGLNPLFYLDCLPRSDGTTEVTCPPGTCCSFCCSDGSGCECTYRGTTFEFLCDVQ